MSANLLELTKSIITPEVSTKLAGSTGENETNIKVSINSILPILVSGLILKVAHKKDASEIMMLVKVGGYDGNLLNNLSYSMNNKSRLDLMIRSSSDSLNSLFGNKLKTLTDMVSKENGVSQRSAASLLGFFGTLVMSMTGRQILSNNLNATALKNYLSDQQEFLSELISPGIAGYLGFDSDIPSSLFCFDENGDNDESRFKRFAPWMLIVICAILMFVLWRSCGTDKQPESHNSNDVKYELAKSDIYPQSEQRIFKNNS